MREKLDFLIGRNALLYCEINVFCAFILCFLLFKIYSGTDKQKKQIIFSWVIYFSIIYFLLDAVWKLIDIKLIPATVTINYVINALYFSISSCIFYCWMYYCEFALCNKFTHKIGNLLIMALPLMILIISAFLSIKTSALFYITEDNKYFQGQFHWIITLINYFYMLVPGLHAFYLGFKKENFMNRGKYLSFFVFLLFPISSVLLQSIIHGTPLRTMGITMGILLVYINNMDNLISKDPLTGLNNRTEMFRFLKYMFREVTLDSTKSLSMFLVDLDNLKYINMVYGSMEGDKALINLSKILQEVGSLYPSPSIFIARYGGDKFIIVLNSSSESSIKKIKSSLGEGILHYNASRVTPYEIKVTVGEAVFDETISSVKDLYLKAKADLMRAKKED